MERSPFREIPRERVRGQPNIMLIVKIGGGKNINWDYVSEDITSLIKEKDIILVHGASEKRDEIADMLGHPTSYLTSPSGQKGVYTDKSALEILTMVYAGLVNKSIVSQLQRIGINAVGLSGADGKVWEGKRKKYLVSVEDGKEKLVKDTYTGKVTKVNTELLRLLVDKGYIPIITQPAITSEGELINTDNDRNIAVMAGQLGVKELVVLFEAPGLLEDPEDENTLVEKVDRKDLDKVMKKVSGRMKKKVLGAKEAIEEGVEKIYWGDARVEKPITSALKGKGTVIL